MNYHDITTNDMKNGIGLRVVLWVAGCNHRCKDCHNPITWDPDGGILFDESAKDELFDKLSQSHIHGITFSGGDPFHPLNRDTIYSLLKEIKEKFPDKSVWVYTGYTWEELLQSELMTRLFPYIDVIVDGPFIEEQEDTRFPWAGSRNQRVIDVKMSILKGKVEINGSDEKR